MPSKDAEVRRVQAGMAILSRHRPADDPELLEAKREYALLMLEPHTPELKPEQIALIRRLMGPGSPAAEAAVKGKQESAA